MCVTSRYVWEHIRALKSAESTFFSLEKFPKWLCIGGRLLSTKSCDCWNSQGLNYLMGPSKFGLFVSPTISTTVPRPTPSLLVLNLVRLWTSGCRFGFQEDNRFSQTIYKPWSSNSGLKNVSSLGQGIQCSTSVLRLPKWPHEDGLWLPFGIRCKMLRNLLQLGSRKRFSLSCITDTVVKSLTQVRDRLKLLSLPSKPRWNYNCASHWIWLRSLQRDVPTCKTLSCWGQAWISDCFVGSRPSGVAVALVPVLLKAWPYRLDVNPLSFRQRK